MLHSANFRLTNNGFHIEIYDPLSGLAIVNSTFGPPTGSQELISIAKNKLSLNCDKDCFTKYLPPNSNLINDEIVEHAINSCKRSKYQLSCWFCEEKTNIYKIEYKRRNRRQGFKKMPLCYDCFKMGIYLQLNRTIQTCVLGPILYHSKHTNGYDEIIVRRIQGICDVELEHYLVINLNDDFHNIFGLATHSTILRELCQNEMFCDSDSKDDGIFDSIYQNKQYPDIYCTDCYYAIFDIYYTRIYYCWMINNMTNNKDITSNIISFLWFI